MNILIKNNLVYKNPFSFDEFDFDLKETDSLKRDIYVGQNGVGKSFILKVFSAIAYLYSVKDHSPMHAYDIQKVIQNLIDIQVGDISNKELPNNELLIRHFTSYHKSENDFVYNEDDKKLDEVNLTLKLGGKLAEALDSYHYIRIGRNAKVFFDSTNIIYYSNSQFSSNEKFFSERASSFNSTNVDVPFWMLYRMLPQIEKFEVKIWMNNSWGYANFDQIKKEIITEKFKDHIKYVLRHVFIFYTGQILDNIIEDDLFKSIEEMNAEAVKGKRKFPYIFLSLKKMSVENYLVLLILKDVIDIFNFEIYYNSTPFDKLNSGCRYSLTLECLKNVCRNGKKTLLIIDEPENSLHITLQREIAQKKDDLQILLATHSPVFVMSFISEFPDNFVLHILSKDENKILNEEIVTDNYLYNNSIDEMAAEFFSYAPFIDEWDKVNSNIKKENLIDVNKFYEEIKDLDQV